MNVIDSLLEITDFLEHIKADSIRSFVVRRICFKRCEGRRAKTFPVSLCSLLHSNVRRQDGICNDFRALYVSQIMLLSVFRLRIKILKVNQNLLQLSTDTFIYLLVEIGTDGN